MARLYVGNIYHNGICCALQCTNLLDAVKDNGLTSLADAVASVLVRFSCHIATSNRIPVHLPEPALAKLLTANTVYVFIIYSTLTRLFIGGADGYHAQLAS